MIFLSEIFRVFFALCQRVGAVPGLPGCLALPASIEAWGRRGDGWHRGAPSSFTTPTLSPMDVLLLAVPTVAVLTLQPCAVACVCVFTDSE